MCACSSRFSWSDSIRPYGLWPSPQGSSVQGDSPGKNTRVGHHALFQGIFQIQGLNPHPFCLLHWLGGFFTTSATWEALSEKALCLCPVTAMTLEMSSLVGATVSPADILRCTDQKQNLGAILRMITFSLARNKAKRCCGEPVCLDLPCFIW